MQEFLNLIVTLAAVFTVMDYTLGRCTVKDPLRAVLAAVVAVLFVLVRGMFPW
jgi:hypothetical protein